MKYSIEQIKAMLAAATPGPWEYKVFEHDEYVHNGEMNLIIANGSDVSSSFCAATTPDLELISAAPTIIKDLLNEVERCRLNNKLWRDAEKENSTMRELLESLGYDLEVILK